MDNRADHILLFDIDPPRTRYAGDKRKAFLENLEQRIAAIPGVDSASLSSTALVSGSSNTSRVVVEGRTTADRLGERSFILGVGHTFFGTMRIPILYGRDLSRRDHAKAPRVAIVNQQFLKQFFRNETPVGKTFKHGNQVLEIVGMWANPRYDRICNSVPPTLLPLHASSRIGHIRSDGACRSEAHKPLGIRMALGAQRRQVMQMILRETVLLTIIGVVLGIAGAAALTRYVRAMLYGLEPFDPLTFTTAIAVMVCVALLAGGQRGLRRG